jgi:hypothetical protein
MAGGPDILPVPGAPGRFLNTVSGQPTIIEEIFDDAVFDTIEIPAATALSNQEYLFFDVSSNKKLNDAKFGQNKRIPGSHMLKLAKIGLYVRQAYGGAKVDGIDTILCFENGAYAFSLGKRLVSEGPAWRYPSGTGYYGVSTKNDFSLIGLGVPSPAAVPALAEQHEISDQMTLNAGLSFPTRTWAAVAGQTIGTTTGGLFVTNTLQGVLRKPVGV